MGSSPDQYRQFLDFHYATICTACGDKVMDPDKKRGQTIFKGTCPSCGKDSKEARKKSRKERRRERRELRNKNAVHHT